MGSRIIGGTEVPEAKYPFAAALVLDENPLRGPFCGGSLIAPQVVLTAARCFTGIGTENSDVNVVLGCSDIDLVTQSSSCEVIPVVKTVLHPLYDPSVDESLALVDESNDVAVLKLGFPSNQPAITLGKARPQVGDFATVIGWGPFDEFGYGDYLTFDNKVLREVNLAIIGNEACQQANDQALEFINFPFRFPITDEMMCGIGDFQGTCRSDDGGPLFMGCDAEANKEVQVGIVSFGDACAVEGFPEKFTSISAPSVFNFIEQETLKLGGVGIKFTEDLDGACSLLPFNVEPTPFPTRLRSEYKCNLDNFASSDGCHCECGFADPDCRFMQGGGYLFFYEVINCDPGQFCFDDRCVEEIPNIVATLPPRRTSEPTENPTVARTQNPTTSPTELVTESPSEADVETDAPTVRDDGGLDPPTKEEEKDDANQEVMEILLLAVLLVVLCLLLLLCSCCLCKAHSKREKVEQPQAGSLVA